MASASVIAIAASVAPGPSTAMAIPPCTIHTVCQCQRNHPPLPCIPLHPPALQHHLCNPYACYTASEHRHR